jgi:hypothetical protein
VGVERATGGVRHWLPGRLGMIALVVVAALVVMMVVRPGAPVVLETRPGLPDGVEADLAQGEPGWVLDEAARRVEVYTLGSSSCPTVPRAVDVEGSRMRVTLAPVAAAACTEDLAYTTTVVAVPEQVTDLDELEVELVEAAD